MAINFNVNPYYDDYDEDKGYHRILFKPGFAVQARELTQLQTIMQKQVERIGRHFFEDGAMVIPGQVAVDTKVRAVKLTTASVGSTNLSTLFDGQNKTVEGLSTGVEALVVIGLNAEGNDPGTLIVRFTRNGNDYVTSQFAPSETIRIKGTSTTFVCAPSNTVTESSIASIQEGVYFITKNFVKVLPQTIALDKYGNTPTYRIGISVTENIVTELDDGTLYDNSLGTPNEGAPGADRYKIQLILNKLPVDSTLDQDFYELVRIEDGVLLKLINQTQYSFLEKTLARRTFDESGNYTVDPFRIQIKEHRNNNRGTWTASTSYLMGDVVRHNGNSYVALSTASSTGDAPTHTQGAVTKGVKWLYQSRPIYNQGIYQNGSASKLAIGIEPGKAYVNGYEVEKIATQYIPIDKARTTEVLSNKRIDMVVGNYVLVSNVYISSSSAFDLSTFSNVNLYDRITTSAGTASGVKVGTAAVRGLYYHSGNASLANSIFKLSLFDINLDPTKTFSRDVKQIQTSGFSADIALPYPKGSWSTFALTNEYKEKDWMILEGSGNIEAGGTVITGSGTSFLTELEVDDYVYIDEIAELRRITQVSSDYKVTLDASVVSAAVGSRLYRAQMLLKEQQFLPAVFVMPYRSIKETTNPVYYNAVTLTGTSNGSGNLTFNSNTLSTSTQLTNLTIFNNSTGRPQTGTGLVISGATFTITGLSNTTSYRVIAPVQSTTARKTKTSNIESKLITNNLIYKASEISLDRIDVYKVDNVFAINPEATGLGNVDITHHFTFDDGQRASHYGVSKIIRKPGYPIPTANIRIDYRYFSHGPGNYFDASSYGDIKYEDIPALITEGISVKLTDVLDFRPVANIITGNYEPAVLPHRDIASTFSYEHYLPRQDKITIDLRGNVFAITGAPAIVPGEPENHTSGMSLYNILLAPYTNSTQPPEVTYKTIDNKRYTMRDIGNLEKRLQSVEYYTALSLLEQDTASLSIKDTLGLERFKNGFVVDNFEGHGVGDVSSPDYKCSIDMENNELRPPYVMRNVNLVEKTPSSADRNNRRYQVTGDLVTLKYTDVVLVDQSYASRLENINPFAVASFTGRLSLNPPGDEWFETSVRPDVIVNEEGNFDSITASLAAAGVLGTVWNAWETQWTGTPRVVAESSQTLTKPYPAPPVAPVPTTAVVEQISTPQPVVQPVVEYAYVIPQDVGGVSVAPPGPSDLGLASVDPGIPGFADAPTSVADASGVAGENEGSSAGASAAAGAAAAASGDAPAGASEGGSGAGPGTGDSGVGSGTDGVGTGGADE